MVFHMLKSIVGTKIKAQHRGLNLRIKWMAELIRAAFRVKTNGKATILPSPVYGNNLIKM
ncbi:hypothetical protein SAMN04488603_102614 [Paenibacillus sp. cl130]|uniref:Transposase n=1 Tax=Paenibacillus polymyxa TaxID=1406 RepID=A0ABX2Z4A6_PAEPO|nr:hypothetical protein A7312_17125 [Paenibacillus polymyxa]SFR08890.1 hypothetical protein SAMN04488603_102614 [Paenibacillus sp. cl130]